MNKSIKNFVATLSLGTAQKQGRLRIRPILSTADFKLSILTLEEALEAGVLEISEVNDTGRVSTLRVFNSGNKPVVIFEGEELIGAKQNRIVNKTVIIDANSEVTIDVSCVERGRWGYTSTLFSASDISSGPRIRRVMHQSYSESVLRGGRGTADQGAIWNEIDRKMNRMNVASPTASAQDVSATILKQVAEYPGFDRNTPDNGKQFSKSDPQEANPREADIQHIPGQIGYIAFIDDGLASCDIYGSEEIFRLKFSKIKSGLMIDAHDHGLSFPLIEEQEIMESLGSFGSEFAEDGKGEIRFSRGNLSGTVKTLDGEFVHAALFGKTDHESAP
ncbi:MAG: DUF6569 family protein [Pyrinomonadaceae bacterium]